ncbi:hypothetical protein BGZ49_007579 [Haplosporangium sp. Z 27]|nr:hypothetical protein BGZ49_007579 [Haplosporangium sp. Z 27]
MPLRLPLPPSHIPPFEGQRSGNSAFISRSRSRSLLSAPTILSPLHTYLNTTFDDYQTCPSVDNNNSCHEYSYSDPHHRPMQVIARIANWFSLIGSLMIIIHIPKVTQRAPSQTKRMVIILFTAISNFGFALANIVTAFTLATIPAAAGDFVFNECGRYCWFKPSEEHHTCKITSLWAWTCFYGWMVLFLATLFASTIFVMYKIASAVIASRRDLKSVANQPLNYVTIQLPPPQFTSRSQSFSHIERLSSQDYITTLASLGVDVSSDSNEGTPTSDRFQSAAQSVPQSANNTSSNLARVGPLEKIAILRAKERPFFIAILRQSLYPIAISVSGCLQIIADLTIVNGSDFSSTFGYVANVATSIQGFLFFLVFMFDPAMIQIRQQWRKYWIWKYYIEFYYGLGMPQEGRAFEDRFMEMCSSLNQYGNESKFDQLTKPPPYSWLLQHDNIMMPDFQTTHPLANVMSNSTLTTGMGAVIHSESSSEELGSEFEGGEGVGQTILGAPPSRFKKSHESPMNPSLNSPQSAPFDLEKRSSNNNNGSSNNGDSNNNSDSSNSNDSIARTDDTNPSQYLSSDTPIPPANFDNEDPTIQIDIPSQSESSTRKSSFYRTGINADGMSGSDIGECSKPLPIPRPSNLLEDRGYDDSLNESSGFETDRERTTTSHRKLMVKISDPHDVFTFTRLKKITTIGGSDMTPRDSRRSIERSPTPGSRRIVTAPTPRKISIKGGYGELSSLGLWFKRLLLPGYKDDECVRRQYREQFKYPRWAYLMHLIVRRVYIPRKVRLPQIPNPFKKLENSSTSLESASQQTTRSDIIPPQIPDPVWTRVTRYHGSRNVPSNTAI